MPTLDVTRVLFNPRFCDRTLKYTRQTIVTDDDGISSTIEETKPFAGVVTVDSSLEAQIRMAGQVVSGRILIVTITHLIAGETGKTGDIVKYQGRNYLVKSVDPYTAYGRGFVQAHCELLPFDGGSS
ncbi:MULTISPECIES: head-tail adaptor [Providencia]|uniref:head-tail adaptor n=1 Tax=Providencia TaxID=586 RepID=UPI001EE6E228|nr:head-tail adaptor [Providencia rettgeri]MCG5377601.1 head-tail adaptor [Providencia rettgeri]